jgi:hypothetical protein
LYIPGVSGLKQTHTYPGKEIRTGQFSGADKVGVALELFFAILIT